VAEKRITASSDLLQEDSSLGTVNSQGEQHSLAGLLGYLEESSYDRLSSFDLRQAAVGADARRTIGDALEAWLDALALRRFTQWQMTLPRLRKVGGNGNHQPAAAVPEDYNTFDPFFRPAAERAAIQRIQTSRQRRRWPLYFRRWGCLVCGSTDDFGALGFCRRCYLRVDARLAKIEAELRGEALHDR
jgi:hypothetical protein